MMMMMMMMMRISVYAMQTRTICTLRGTPIKGSIMLWDIESEGWSSQMDYEKGMKVIAPPGCALYHYLRGGDKLDSAFVTETQPPGCSEKDWRSLATSVGSRPNNVFNVCTGRADHKMTDFFKRKSVTAEIFDARFHKHTRSYKLTPAQELAILQARYKDTAPEDLKSMAGDATQLAARFNINQGKVFEIWRGQSRSEVALPWLAGGGKQHGPKKLTDEQVAHIFKARDEDTVPDYLESVVGDAKALAKRFDISHGCVHDIWSGRRHRKVTVPLVEGGGKQYGPPGSLRSLSKRMGQPSGSADTRPQKLRRTAGASDQRLSAVASDDEEMDDDKGGKDYDEEKDDVNVIQDHANKAARSPPSSTGTHSGFVSEEDDEDDRDYESASDSEEDD